MGDPVDPEMERAKAAVRAFEDAGLAPGGLVASFRLWHYPQKGSWVTWVLFVPPGGEPYEEDGRVREMGWNRDAAGPEPEVWTREAVVPAAVVRRAVSRASRTALVDDHLGSSQIFPDFTEYGIEGYARSGTTYRIQWETPVPYPFRTLAVWFSRTRGLLENRLG